MIRESDGSGKFQDCCLGLFALQGHFLQTLKPRLIPDH